MLVTLNHAGILDLTPG